MLSKELLAQLQTLNSGDKLRVVQMLVNELAAEEAILSNGTRVSIYTPPGNEAAAQVLFEALRAAETANRSKPWLRASRQLVIDSEFRPNLS